MSAKCRTFALPSRYVLIDGYDQVRKELDGALVLAQQFFESGVEFRVEVAHRAHD
jgi:hypothetical protein